MSEEEHCFGWHIKPLSCFGTSFSGMISSDFKIKYAPFASLKIIKFFSNIKAKSPLKAT
jgi:hypothetical protein